MVIRRPRLQLTSKLFASQSYIFGLTCSLPQRLSLLSPWWTSSTSELQRFTCEYVPINFVIRSL